ncbi:ROK family protein [Oceanimonas sp. AH20CE76]|uniref:ROK family protein n=1 Tax=Oceanimonas sp. AH20CE76 TaxID=2977120 RepID=UPI0031FEDE8A
MIYGFDIGGTKIAFAAYDDKLHPQLAEVHATPKDDYDAFLALITEQIQRADSHFGAKMPVGFGFPGIQNEKGAVLAPNVPAIHGRNLLGDLRLRLERPVYGNNDANCFLLSEYHGGAVAGKELALGLTLGTGVGGALIHKGCLISGRRFGCGEFGHGPVGADVLARYPGLPLYACGCGRIACLETYVSGTGLARLAQYTGSEQTGQQLMDSWLEGDARATTCMNVYLDILSSGLGTLITQLDPDAIVLGGGISETPALYQALASRLPASLMTGMQAPPVYGPVFGGAGGVRGAALLARQPDWAFSSLV